MRLAPYALLLACAAGAARGAAAQRADTLAVSLDRALEIARLNNPTYRRAVNDLGLNGPESRYTWGTQILPTLALDLRTQYFGNLQRRAIDPFGNPVANPNAEYLNYSSTCQGIGIGWTLRGPSFLALAKGQDALNADRTLSEQVAGEDLRIAVRRQFFEALEQEELLEVERAGAEAARTDQETAERLFELALRSRVDVLQAELQVQQQQLEVRQQLGRRDQARLALRTVLGQEDLPLVRPEATEVPIFDPSTIDEAALVRLATETSSPVRRQASALRQAEAQVSLSEGSYWPTLQAGFTVGRFVQSNATESLFSFGGLGDARYSTFSLQVSIPFLNDPLGSRLRSDRAEVARDNQRDALRQARLQAEQQARSALVTIEDRWESLQIQNRSLAIAREALELAREEYRLGTRTFEELQGSIRSEAATRRQLIQARYGFVDALLDLEQAMGGPVR